MSKLYQIWSRLGVAFDVVSSSDSAIDLEEILLKTSQEGRRDSRLLFGMRGWLCKHHELVNSARLICKIKSAAETAVLGAVLESVVLQSPRSNLKYVIKYCHRLQQPDFVFDSVRSSPVIATLNKKENLPLWKKWGLISREMDDMKGAIRDKKYVLKNNVRLALRALFGAGLKAEVLSFFLNHKSGNARQIALAIGLSYEPVHSELSFFKNIGLAEEKKKGHTRIFSLSPKYFERTLLPFAA